MKNHRIRQKRKEIGLTQLDVAKSVGVSKTSVSQWESGDTSPKGENLYTLCRTLQCSLDWLLYGKKEPDSVYPKLIHNVSPGPTIVRRVPLISWIKAGDWSDSDCNLVASDVTEWIETTAKVSGKAFALRVHGDSMTNPTGSPSIPDGSIVIIDPECVPQNGNIVVARLDGTSEATLKKLVVDVPNKYLKPLNPDYKLIQIQDNCIIVGVAKKVEIEL